MITTHRFRAVGTCPVDPDTVDIYDVTIETGMVIEVETILVKSRELLAASLFQERYTNLLQEALSAYGVRVTTVGVHSGVETTCQAG